MTKLEAWKKFNEAVPGLEATEHTLKQSSHGKAFSYAWDAAVEAEREECARVCEARVGIWIIPAGPKECADAIRARGNQ